MATTIKISDTLNWCAAFILNRPTSGVAGVANEPGLTNANLIMSTILAPPFAWQWNRKEVTFSTVVGTSDYLKAYSDFGWLERATISNSTLTPSIYDLEIATSLSVDSTQSQPFKICPILDDNAGNITFRLFPVPDQVYTVTLTYQKAPILATVLGGNWAPIPDKYSFLYERGMLAHLHAMYDSATYLQELQLFFRQLVGCSEGLSETAKAIFLEERLSQLRTEASVQGATTVSSKRGI